MFDDDRGSETAAETEQTTGAPSAKKMRFGRQDLSDAYDAAKDLIIKHRMLRLCEYEVVPEGNQLTICNVWRIVRAPDMHVRTYEKCLQSGAWQEVSRLEGWPVIPFWPIAKTTSLHWWESIVERAVTKALWAVGYSELRADQGAHLDKEPAKKEMQPWQILQIMCARYVRMLRDESSLVAAKALRAAFYQHIYEKELASALLSVDYKYIRFHQYLGFARHRDSVLKVASEHRNLLSLLPYISPLKWGRPDLFSRKVWVRDGRKITPIDRKPLKASKPEFADHRFFQSIEMRSRDLRSCPTSSAWRWLTRAKSSVVTAWTQSDCNWQFAEVLATAQGNLSVPAVVFVHLLRYSAASRIGDLLACQVATDQLAHEVSIKLVRIFLTHCARKWKSDGYAALRQWLKEKADFRPVLDYLRAEGLQQGQPDKNASWTSLLRRTADWHERVRIEAMRREEELAARSWQSVLDELTVAECRFVPLITAGALASEGYELHHCVGGPYYCDACYEGTYRVFAVQAPDGERSTLGMAIYKGAAHWDQHYGHYNKRVPGEVEQAGREVVRMYTEQLRLSAKGVGPAAIEMDEAA